MKVTNNKGLAKKSSAKSVHSKYLAHYSRAYCPYNHFNITKNRNTVSHTIYLEFGPNNKVAYIS